MSAVSSTVGPRDALIRIALFFIVFSCAAPIMPRVSPVSGTCRQTKSDCASSSSSSTRFAPYSCSACAFGLRFV